MRHIYIVFSFDQKVRAVYIDEGNAITLYKAHEEDGWYYEEHVLADWDEYNLALEE